MRKYLLALLLLLPLQGVAWADGLTMPGCPSNASNCLATATGGDTKTFGNWFRGEHVDTSGNRSYDAFVSLSIAGTVTAAGTDQGTATVLASQVNIVTTVAAGTGVKLPSFNATVMNRGANNLRIYPPSGMQIESYGNNNPVQIPPNGSADFYKSESSRFRVR